MCAEHDYWQTGKASLGDYRAKVSWVLSASILIQQNASFNAFLAHSAMLPDQLVNEKHLLHHYSYLASVRRHVPLGVVSRE